SPDLFAVLARSLVYSQLSDGAFDVTVGPVVALWRQARRTRQLPAKEDLDRARATIGFSNIVLDRNARTVLLLRSDMRLDLGAIAKGYAADQAPATLKARGLERAL